MKRISVNMTANATTNGRKEMEEDNCRIVLSGNAQYFCNEDLINHVYQ